MTTPPKPYNQLWQIWNFRHVLTTAAIVTGACAAVSVVHSLTKESSVDKWITIASGLAVAEVSRRTAFAALDLQDTNADIVYAERRQLIAQHTSNLKQPEMMEALVTEEEAELEFPVVTDVVQYWLSQEKHLLIVGGTGAGKTTFVNAFTRQLSTGNYKHKTYSDVPWHLYVYDLDATVDDWTQANQVYSNVNDIYQCMTEDLAKLEPIRQERNAVGSKRWKPEECVLFVADEFPALAMKPKRPKKDAVDIWNIASEWISTHAKQSRKLGRFVCVISQNDTVGNLGLTGDAKVRDNCFVRVYLGDDAIARAKAIDDQSLVDWLESHDKYSVCVVDDKPALRPQ